MEHRQSAGLRVVGWLSVVDGLLVMLVGGSLLSHFIRIGPSLAVAYIWSGGLVVIGAGMTAAGIWILRSGRL